MIPPIGPRGAILDLSTPPFGSHPAAPCRECWSGMFEHRRERDEAASRLLRFVGITIFRGGLLTGDLAPLPRLQVFGGRRATEQRRLTSLQRAGNLACLSDVSVRECVAHRCYMNAAPARGSTGALDCLRRWRPQWRSGYHDF